MHDRRNIDYFVLNFKIHFLSLDHFHRLEFFTSTTIFLMRVIGYLMHGCVSSSAVIRKAKIECTEQRTRSNKKIAFYFIYEYLEHTPHNL